MEGDVLVAGSPVIHEGDGILFQVCVDFREDLAILKVVKNLPSCLLHFTAKHIPFISGELYYFFVNANSEHITIIAQY